MFTVEIHATSHIGRVRKGTRTITCCLEYLASRRPGRVLRTDGEFVIESQKFEVDDNGVVMAVSDGMGGALAGEVASTMAVETRQRKAARRGRRRDSDAGDVPSHHLIARLYNATVFRKLSDPSSGTQRPAISGNGRDLYRHRRDARGVDIIQVGDSRAYLVRNGKIYQVTKDQSLVQQLIDAQQISAEEAETHTLKNVILQALGAQNEIYPVSARVAPCKDDVFLLCSDGLSNKVSAADMQRIVTENFDKLQNGLCRTRKRSQRKRRRRQHHRCYCEVRRRDLPDAVEDEEVKLELIDLGGHSRYRRSGHRRRDDTAEIR